ncbi:hypothetical protein DL770_001077 [Monosporascus sp. CRB-9-2]|nr:hypothetical protein DL770_001077 [Monosporascus sp. CRB-9-2]
MVKVSVADFLEHAKITERRAMLEDLKRIVDTAKARFTLRQLSSTGAESLDAYHVRPKSRRNSVVAPFLVGKPCTQETEDLPESIGYDTACQACPPYSGIRAHQASWQVHSLVFRGHHTRPCERRRFEEIPKALWKKAIACWSNAGLLFEDGDVRQEVTEALRKTAKGKEKSVKISLQGSGADDSGRAVEGDCVVED